MFQVIAWPPDADLQRSCTPVACAQLQFQEVRDCSKDPASRFCLVNGGLVDLTLRGQCCVETDLPACMLVRTEDCYALQQPSGFRLIAPWSARGEGKLLAAAFWQCQGDRFVVLRIQSERGASALCISPDLVARQSQQLSALPRLLEFQAMFRIRARTSEILLLKLTDHRWAALRVGWNECRFFQEPSRLLGIVQGREYNGSNPRLVYVICYLALVLDCGWPILNALFGCCGVDMEFSHSRRVKYIRTMHDLWLVFQDKSLAVAV